jgi:putative serine protease PepD
MPAPSTEPTAPLPPEGPGRVRRWWVALAAVLLLIAGTGIGLLLGGGGPVTTTTAAEATTTTISPVVAPVVPGEEPVADVAAALLPSMVQIRTGSGLGSGFVYAEGLILTAAHVVQDAGQVEVRFADGELQQGNVLGTDPAHDVAVVSVERTGVPLAPLALDSEPRVGQLAIALGSPWGLEQTVTAGVVSAVSRPVRGQFGPQVLLQTDAPINPGNSGGVLADREGRVIGINIQIFTTTGTNSGVGFAVPIKVAEQIARQIVAGEEIETAYLGVSGEDSTGAQAGAVITEVVPGGPAADAGLRVGDVVTAVDGLAVRSMVDLAGRIRSYLPDDEVLLDVMRNGETITLTATLSARQD